MAEVRSVPRNTVTGLMSDLSGGAQDWLNKIFYHNKSGFGLGDLFLNESTELFNDMSHGISPIRPVGGNRPILDPRILDAGALFAPFVGAIKNVGKKSLKELFKPNYIHGRSMDHGTDAIEHPLMLMKKDDRQLQDMYSGAAWGDSAPANFPFEFHPKKPLDFDTMESISAVDDILKDIGMTNKFPLDAGGFLTTKGQAALRKHKRSFDEDLGDDGDVTDLIDFAYIPEFREAARKRGYDALVTKKDFTPGGTGYNHDTTIPLDFKDVKAIGGGLEDLLKRKKYTPPITRNPRLSIAEVDEVNFLIKDGKTSLAEITRQTGHNRQTVQNIAKGLHPLQKRGSAKFSKVVDPQSFAGRPSISQNTFNEIEKLLADGKQSAESIGRSLSVSGETVRQIKKGTHFLQIKGNK